MENQELWSKDKMGDAKWVQYLCRLGFSVDFVHRLGAGIDSMGKLLFHVLIGLSYFPNAMERITDCISICSKQESSPDWASHVNTHPSDKPGAQPLAKQGSSPATLSTGTTQSILHTNWDQFEIQPRHFNMTRVMWQAAALTAAFSNDSGNFLSEAQRNASIKDDIFWALYKNFCWVSRLQEPRLSSELLQRLFFLFWKNYFLLKDNRFFQD